MFLGVVARLELQPVEAIYGSSVNSLQPRGDKTKGDVRKGARGVSKKPMRLPFRVAGLGDDVDVIEPLRKAREGDEQEAEEPETEEGKQEKGGGDASVGNNDIRDADEQRDGAQEEA